jgi:hypothetical protein
MTDETFKLREVAVFDLINRPVALGTGQRNLIARLFTDGLC